MPQTPERFGNDAIYRFLYIDAIYRFLYIDAIYRFLYIDAIYRNDLEKHRDEMECGELISNYVTALRNIFWRTKKVLET
jgi:hypothetical protein